MVRGRNAQQGGAGRNGRHGNSSWLGCTGWLGVQHRRSATSLAPQPMACIWPHRFSSAADTTRLRRAAGRRAAAAARKDARCGAARAAALPLEEGETRSWSTTAHTGKGLAQAAAVVAAAQGRPTAGRRQARAAAWSTHVSVHIASSSPFTRTGCDGGSPGRVCKHGAQAWVPPSPDMAAAGLAR